MLYLDASALAKRYFAETGSDALLGRLRQGDKVYTSALSYAELLAAFGRKLRDGILAQDEFDSLFDRLTRDWTFLWNVLEVDLSTMSWVRVIVSQHSVRGADAIHLSTALWLGNTIRLAPEYAAGETKLEFGVADKSLARIAGQYGLSVFDPENP